MRPPDGLTGRAMHGGAEPPAREGAELAALCRACAMCCDGSLFGRTTLRPEEVGTARRTGLRVLPSEAGFEQPCAALQRDDPPRGAGRTCAIYAERPRACRTFVCRLYARHRAEGGPLAPRLAAVRRVREIAEALAAQGWTPDDFDAAGAIEGAGPSDAATAAFVELRRRLEDDFARA